MSNCHLPLELWTEILARVAANSLADLAAAKVTSKSLLIAGNSNEVYRKANILKLLGPFNVRNANAKIFLANSVSAGNPLYLIYKGIQNYFVNGDINIGLTCFKKSSESDCLPSTYIYSIMMICTGQDLPKESIMKFISAISKLNVNELELCRKTITSLVVHMWRRVSIEKSNLHCTFKDQCDYFKGMNRWITEWDHIAENDGSVCDMCRTKAEVEWFRNLVHKQPMRPMLQFLIP